MIIFRRGVFGVQSISFDPNDMRGYYAKALGTEPLPFPNLTSTSTTGIIETSSDPLQSFSKTTRNEIRQVAHVRVDISDTGATDKGYGLYRYFERGRGVRPEPRGNFKKCLEFLAYENGNAVSGVFVIPAAPVARIWHIFSDKAHSKHSRRVIYEACRWCMRTGRTGLDLAKVSGEPNQGGINDFKLSFRPTIVPQYTYEHASRTYRMLRKAKSLLLR
jgi:hypothetical protein